MSSGTNKKLALAAMICAVAMTFIDQTIVSIAVPDIQKDLDLSATGVQWIVNGYLLSLSALFAFGGRIADIAGHKSMVLLGIAIFTIASALCGATPTGSLAEPWLIVFRIIQASAPEPVGVAPQSAEAVANTATPTSTIRRCPAMSARRPPNANRAESDSR